LLSEHVRVPYAYEGKDHVYVTDFYDPTTKVVFEVKHSKEVNLPMNVAKFEAARAFCGTNGDEFCVVTERDLVGYLFPRKLIEEHPKVVLNPVSRRSAA
jgi:hypothetical protein